MQFDGQLMRSFQVFTEYLTRMVIVNLLWIFGVLVGGIVLGIMPATVAVYALIRENAAFPIKLELFSKFWQEYKGCFKQSNIIGLFSLIINILFFYNIRILVFEGGLFSQIILAGTLILLFIYIIGLINFFPIYVRYNFKTLDYIKNTMIIAAVQPIRSLIMFCITILILLLSLAFPPFIIFISVGMLVYAIDTIAKKGVLKNAELVKTEVEDNDDLYYQTISDYEKTLTKEN
jgi:Predicted integral membrane protein